MNKNTNFKESRKFHRSLLPALAAAIVGIPLLTFIAGIPQAMAEEVKTTKDSSPIVLDASLAEIEGKNAQKAAQGDDDTVRIIFWSNEDTYVHWTTGIPGNGTFNVELEYALADICDGSEITVTVGDQSIPAKLITTGSWSNFQTIDIGRVNLTKSNSLPVSVTCTNKPGGFVMNLGSITLTPVAGASTAPRR